jgi:hypothetical protein
MIRKIFVIIKVFSFKNEYLLKNILLNMKRKPIRLTESDLIKIVSRVIKEQEAQPQAQQPAPQQATGECVRKGNFIKNCTKRYAKAEPGLVIVGGNGEIGISLGNGSYLQLDANNPSYSQFNGANRAEGQQSVSFNAANGKADPTTLSFLITPGVDFQTLLSVLNDTDCQKNKTVTYLKTVIKNFGSSQGFLQAVHSNPQTKSIEGADTAANELIKPLTGK